jgi:hypothetical protein
VLVWKFDRFARSVAHLLHALEEFHSLGIRFISLQDQIDTQSPMGKAMFTIIGAMAELESALIAERVKAGMAAAKARGKQLGCPGTPPTRRHRCGSLRLPNRYACASNSSGTGRPCQSVSRRRNCEACAPSIVEVRIECTACTLIRDGGPALRSFVERHHL